MMADLRASSAAHHLDDLRRAMGAAEAAVDAGEYGAAVKALGWAKSVAPKSWAVREAFGIALYLSGDFHRAQSELQAYRRLTGRQDQNHLLADCARASERWAKVDEYVEAMRGGNVHGDRIAEGVIVQAGSRADRGDLAGALRVLESFADTGAGVEPWHLRVWATAADLAEQYGDAERAADYYRAIVSLTGDEDVAARLAELEGD